MVPGRGQAGAVEGAEEIRLADVEPVLPQRGEDLRQGVPLASTRAGPLGDRRALRGRLATGPGGGEEGIDVGVASEVSDDGAHGVDREMEVVGELVGGRALGEVSAADLVVTLRRGTGLLEEAREFRGASHGC
jgi:hypothetical protein